MKFKTITFALAAFGFAMMATHAAAQQQFAKAEDAIKYRQGSFTVMGHHFGRLGAMANGKMPFDAKIAQEDAAVLQTVADLPWPAFGDGTQGGKAKPSIWKERAKYDELVVKFKTESASLVTAAQSGDLAKLKAAFGPAAQSCKSCHEDYRNR